MFNNEYENYMRSVLGYPISNDISTYNLYNNSSNQSFDYNMVNSILTEVRNSGSIVYIYNSNSGLNFLYITPSW